MGLEDFTKDSSSSPNTSTSSKSDSEKGEPTNERTATEELDSKMSFYGSGNCNVGTRPMERVGAMSDMSNAELAKRTNSKLMFGEDHAKLHLPIFTLIQQPDEYQVGERYIMEYPHGGVTPAWNGRVAVCIGRQRTLLGKVHKETIMFNEGTVSKQENMKKLDSKLGSDISADKEIDVYFFGYAIFMRDMAQANMQYREGDMVNRDKIVNKMLNMRQMQVAVEGNNGE